ncbi:MAG: PTS sugar transporter subunit IIA [Planctomycetaceae bacterium]
MMTGFTLSDDTASAADDPGPAKSPSELSLTDVFHENCIEIIRPATGKSSAISLLIQILAREQRIDRIHAEKLVRDLIERERHTSSAIGRGLAFPHLRTRDVTHFAGAIGVAPDGIHFGSLDGEPTKLVFLTLSPWDDREQHQQLLSRLVSLMKDKAVNMRLNHQMQPRDIYAYLTDLDDQS